MEGVGEGWDAESKGGRWRCLEGSVGILQKGKSQIISPRGTLLEEKEMYEEGNRDADKETGLTAESNVKKGLKRQVFSPKIFNPNMFLLPPKNQPPPPKKNKKKKTKKIF